MRIALKLFAILHMIVVCNYSFAQEKPSPLRGSVHGIAQDSDYNIKLQSATVAIYKTKDSSLVSYQLTDDLGEFSFKNIPVDSALQIVISYVGYKTTGRKFVIPSTSGRIELGELNLRRNDDNRLEEVVIKATPPVQMNGDTLEFNADAFTLDKNAVAEDLIRKLPGITVWSDGSITYNGRQINQVLVGGKPFFGGDPRIATQNLPKESIDKIQLYRKEIDVNNSFDSVMNLNIKLKKDRNFGYFGKLGSGAGSERHYEVDGNINFFNNRTQAGIAVAANDVNKLALDVYTLMRNSTFKGNSASIDYQSDFRMQGLNQTKAGGINLQHDFSPASENDEIDQLTANYFVSRNKIDFSQELESLNKLIGDTTLLQLENKSKRSSVVRQTFDIRYDKKKRFYNFYASGDGGLSTESNDIAYHSTTNVASSPRSLNKIANTNSRQSKHMNIGLGFRRFGSSDGMTGPFNQFDINYALNTNGNNDDKSLLTEFISFDDSIQNKSFNRKYFNELNRINQHLDFNFNNLLNGRVRGFSLGIGNTIDLSANSEHNETWDKDSNSQIYLPNMNLTNRMRTTILNERPHLTLEKSFSKSLANRYLKSTQIKLTAEEQFFKQVNHSTLPFQELNKFYKYFIPKAGIIYRNNQFGEYDDNFALNFSKSVNYPTIQQLRPLVDSSNQYVIIQGNPFLRAEKNNSLSFSFKHSSLKAKNTFSYDLNITGTKTNSAFADSVITDTLGRSTYYVTNASNRESLDITANISKGIKFNQNQLQLKLTSNLNWSKLPSYINDTFLHSNNFYCSYLADVHYSYKAWLTINIVQGYTYFRSDQQGEKSITSFTNSYIPTSISSSINISKRLTLNSNISHNRTISTGTVPINFTIWNVSGTFRFLEGNNLELKFAALDLLRQNNSVVNNVRNNILTRETTNVLRQYGMITISYFPRKIGKSNKN